MKKKYLVSGAIALSMVIAAVGASSAMAAGLSPFGGKTHSRPTQMTEAQKTAMQAKMTAVKTAIQNNDYNAWVNAEKAINANSPQLAKVTADNFATFAKDYQDRETKMTEQKTKMDAVNAALQAGDYSAWVSAETAANANSPALSKITATNFSQYAQAFQLRQQAGNILKTLGVDGGQGFGPGHGRTQRN